MSPAVHASPPATESTPVFVYVVEAWAVLATLAPALLGKFFFF
jgi:hypothetical protein